MNHNFKLRDRYIPRLHCPTPSSFHPAYRRVATQTIEWAESQGLFVDERLRRRLARTDCARLGAAVYHDGYTSASLQLATDYMTWLNLHDDLWIDGAGRDPDELDADHGRMLRILRGAAPSAEDHPLVCGLADIRARLLEFGPDLGEFDRRVEQFFTAKSWEFRIHATVQAPDVRTYIQFLSFGFAVFSCFKIGILVRPIRMTTRIRRHAYVELLSTLANNLVCWSNDVISLEREIEEGCTTNLVASLRQEHTLSWLDALERAVDMWNSEMTVFTRIAEQLLSLPGFTSTERGALRDYVGLLNAWVRGNLDHCQSETVLRWEVSEELRQAA